MKPRAPCRESRERATMRAWVLALVLALAVAALARPDVTVHTNPVGGPVPQAVLDGIRAAGASVTHVNHQHGVAHVRLRHANTESLKSIAGVRSVRAALRPTLRSSQGAIALGVPALVSTYGVTGAGIKVGVISDSVSPSAMASLVGAGQMKTATIVAGQAGSGSDEGLALLEVVWDLAPGAALYFATCGVSEDTMAANIAALAALGCHVIVDDVGWAYEPPLHEASPINAAIAAATTGGTVYLAAAGNDGNAWANCSTTWEGPFLAATGNATKLAYGTPSVWKLPISSYGGAAPLAITLWWSDPLGASTNDYDL